MASIRCKACGKHYDYRKEGCCPECGAYNRPPKREWVNADGTVQHMTDAAYEKGQGVQGKVCFEEKECHEEKVCYEEQTRYRSGGDKRHRHSPPPASAPTEQSAAQPTEQSAAQPAERQRKGMGAILCIFVYGVIFVWVMIGVSNTVQSNTDPAPEIVWEQEEIEPAPDWREAYMGQEILFRDGTRLTVYGLRNEEGEGIVLEAFLEKAESDHSLSYTLLYMDREDNVQYLSEYVIEPAEEGKVEIIFPTESEVWEPFALQVDEREGGEEGDLLWTCWIDL